MSQNPSEAPTAQKIANKTSRPRWANPEATLRLTPLSARWASWWLISANGSEAGTAKIRNEIAAQMRLLVRVLQPIVNRDP